MTSMAKPRVVVFVQARMGSSRLPGKIMRPILGKPVLLHQLPRIRRAITVDEAVVITTADAAEDPVAALCETNEIPYYRGSALNLLDRHYQAAKRFGADFVVKIPSDSPLTDPAVVDEVISLWLRDQTRYDYVSNYHPPTFPDGLDVEGCPFPVLEIAWREATKPHEREHTFPFIWDQPERFRVGNAVNPRGDMFMTHRWTLDYEEDFEFMKAVFEHFRNKPDFAIDDILSFLKRAPEIADINKKYNGVNWYRHIPGELKTVAKELSRNEPDNGRKHQITNSRPQTNSNH